MPNPVPFWMIFLDHNTSLQAPDILQLNCPLFEAIQTSLKFHPVRLE